MQIEVEFEIFKSLTMLLENEQDTYSDVIRRLILKAGNPDPEAPENALAKGVLSSKGTGWLGALHAYQPKFPIETENALLGLLGGFASRDLMLPNGTLLRAAYKGSLYGARIDHGRWIDENGDEHTSPSAAATAITGTNVNGLRFWEAKRPGDTQWQRLEGLVQK